MESKIEYRLFKKYYQSGIQLTNGVYFDVDFDGELYIFKMNNPDDTAYTKSAIMAHIDEKLGDFYDALGIKFNWNYLSEKYTLEDVEEIYISKNLFKDTDEILKNIEVLKFETYSSDLPEEGLLGVEHISFGYRQTPSKDGVTLINFVRAYDAVIDGEEVNVDNGVHAYQYRQRMDRYDESERNYQSIDYLLNNYQLFCDSSWQVFSTHTVFEN